MTMVLTHDDARRTVARETRLAALRVTQLLDSSSEEFFDRLTRMAAELIGAPAAFLSLVDEQRDFYKNVFRFGEPLASERQIEGVTFCHYALLAEGALVIDDAREHPIYRDVPTVQTLGVIAYLGVPLTLDEQPLGAFCVIDREPRQWTDREIEIVTALARAANAEIAARVRAKGTATATLEDVPDIQQLLSPREREILEGMLAGKRLKEIAFELDVSDKTVATHRFRLLRKLELRDNRELFLYAIRHRLIDAHQAAVNAPARV
jgi:GAF domain-containing protein